MTGPGRNVAGHGSRSSRLFARRRGSIAPVPVDDVVRIDASAVGAELVTAAGTLDLDGTLGGIEARLDPSDFVRVHRSHIVNLTHVTSIRRYDDRRLEVRLSNGSTVVASQKGSRALRDVIR
jgi:two-component system LytT family response regulator